MLNALVGVVLGTSIDCPDVIEFAKGLNMNNVNPVKFQSLTNCCSSSGTICSGGRVVAINWRRLSLDGVLNLQYLPDSVDTLILSSNTIQSLPNDFSIADKLTLIDLSGNGIVASFPEYWPSHLIDLNLSCNFITGALPCLPSTLETINVAYNSLSGSIINAFTPNITSVSINQNFFSGNLPNTVPLSLKSLYVQDNLLSGILPYDLTMLETLFLRTTFDGNLNSFQGFISLGSPSTLYLSNLNVNMTLNSNSNLFDCDISVMI